MAFVDDVEQLQNPRTADLMRSFAKELGKDPNTITNITVQALDIPETMTFSDQNGVVTRNVESLYGKFLTDEETSRLKSNRDINDPNSVGAPPAITGLPNDENPNTPDRRNIITGTQDPSLTRLENSGLPAGAQFPGNNTRSSFPIVRQNNLGVNDLKVRIVDNSGLIVAQGGLLDPLVADRGVIFPYTPKIDLSYTASYQPESLTHSNYEYMFYQSSAVSEITISCNFTARNATEAAYVLATQQFFRAATKMFYGQDAERGLPPVVFRLSGHGVHQFNNVPVVITAFTHSYPDDVDYISVNTAGGVSRVPVVQLFSITAKPLYSRSSITNNFSLKEFSAGRLLGGFI